MKKQVKQVNHQELPPVVGMDEAPVIYSDGAVTFGVNNGVLQLELGVTMVEPAPDGGAKNKVKIVANLRLSPRAAKTIVDAIQGCAAMLKREREHLSAARQAPPDKPALAASPTEH